MFLTRYIVTYGALLPFYLLASFDSMHVWWMISQSILGSFLCKTNLIFFAAYLAFEKYVEHQFNKKIKIFHSDGGGEFVNSRLASHFLATGVVHKSRVPIHQNKQVWLSDDTVLYVN